VVETSRINALRVTILAGNSYPYYQDKKNSNNVNINFKTKKKDGNNEKNYSQYITSNNTYFPTI